MSLLLRGLRALRVSIHFFIDRRRKLCGDESLPFVVAFAIGAGRSLAILSTFVGTSDLAKKKAA